MWPVVVWFPGCEHVVGEVDVRDEKGQTALMIAAYHGGDTLLLACTPSPLADAALSLWRGL